jgi:DNA-nicking Smr family endonuclease
VAGRRRGLSQTDREQWAAYARLLTALPGRAIAEPAAPEPPAVPMDAPASPLAAPPVHQPAAPPALRPALAVGAAPSGLDKATWAKFRTGKLASVRTLDLHGRTAQRAYHALHAFLLSAHADGVRCVEVITGRGSGEQGGVLKRELPHWLNDPSLRPLVLAASHPHPANPGSVRLLLRRIR